MAPLDAAAKSTGNVYLDAWSSISRSMEAGVSWSGHERNVAWLNMGDGTFVEASTVAGFDHTDDGRVVCRTDWDRDGDVDLWLRSRNGVTLRYLENQANPERFLEVSGGVGATSLVARFGTGDATAPGSRGSQRALVVPMTDGYLAAPSRRITVALPSATELVALGDTSVGPAKAGARRFTKKDGAWVEALTPLPQRPALGEPGGLPESRLPTRTVLRSALPLPPTRLQALGVPQEREPNARAARLLVVRSSDCPTCESVLPEALPQLAAGAMPVQVIEFAVSLELASQNSDQEDSAAALRTIVASVLGPGAELALPLSILMDAQGAVQVIYQGDLDAESVAQDAAAFVFAPVQGAFRTAWGRPGAGRRWFHGSPRALASLRADLASQGLSSDADFYTAIARTSR